MPSVRLPTLLLAILPAAAAAQMPSPAPSCTAPAALPAELSGWSKPTPLKAAATDPTKAQLTLARAVTATLLPAPGIRYPLRPEKPGTPATHGGLFAFTVGEAGRYRVALGAGAWVDVVKDGAAITSVAHGHGPDCSGVRKMVDFDLEPGRYMLQIAGNATPTLALMVVRLRA